MTHRLIGRAHTQSDPCSGNSLDRQPNRATEPRSRCAPVSEAYVIHSFIVSRCPWRVLITLQKRPITQHFISFSQERRKRYRIHRRFQCVKRVRAIWQYHVWSNIWLVLCCIMMGFLCRPLSTGDPLHSRALAHSRAPLFTQPCPHCSHRRAPGEQWARLCVFTLQGCVQAARLCGGSPVLSLWVTHCHWNNVGYTLNASTNILLSPVSIFDTHSIP